MKLDTSEYEMVELTASEVRDLTDEDLSDDLVAALDKAQGPVFSGEVECNYLIIKIVKGRSNG